MYLSTKYGYCDRTRVEGLISDLREAMNQDNFDRIKSLTQELQQALMQIGSAVYAQAGGTTTGEDVIDADFVESK